MIMNSTRIMCRYKQLTDWLATKFLFRKPAGRTMSYVRPGTELDTAYLCNPDNLAEIEDNVKRRDALGDIRFVQQLYQDFQSSKSDKAWSKFMSEAIKIPNRTLEHRPENKQIKIVGEARMGHKFSKFADIANKYNWCRTENLGNFCGPRSYYFFGELVELEQALIELAVQKLLSHNFHLVSVPDILPAEAIESCGMPTTGQRNQVFRLNEQHGPNLCLSGTAEMGLGARFMDKKIPQEKLPYKVAAISRCFRAETSNLVEERGLYRVHQFTKVEMFALTEGNLQSSQAVQNEFIELQTDFFESLNLHFRVLDMASNELGNPALRKVDLEAWMLGRQMWGELCSCSDCTDFQSRRLNIRVAETGQFVHTVNGTALAVPRTLMALVENNQNRKIHVVVPDALREIMQRDLLGQGCVKMPIIKVSKKLDGKIDGI
ncbi:serine--tRNA ligase, mitochondrial-like [Neocloeon triangulifer]|uniref:serine--tRNA ligase, mitochondrial-like n=1 Tax=Neocloeon triangulifer TaxID=2078957 RepID=UPI00286F9F69|nr:serine--tRNA ligase, mitochondrial-like [Neocloeon triangulifer]